VKEGTMNIIERHFNKRARLAKLRAQAGKTKRARFVVICDKPAQRAVGVYTSFKKADGDATAWGGYVPDPANAGRRTAARE
jgi:hypothetical protein